MSEEVRAMEQIAKGDDRCWLCEKGIVVTFRVVRLTLQTPKLWLVGVATDRDAPYL